MPLTGGTLTIDIGGAGVKMLVLDSRGDPVGERARMETPRPATPRAMVEMMVDMAGKQSPFERVSVGFPGVVVDGRVMSAQYFDEEWIDFALADRLQEQLRRPVRVANDADIQGFVAIEGRGVELVLTLGTGLGSALFYDGALIPNLEMGRHPFAEGKTYADYVGRKALEKIERKKWSRRVIEMVEQIQPVWNCRLIHLGGGNAKKLEADLPPNVRIVPNLAALLGGLYLWR